MNERTDEQTEQPIDPVTREPVETMSLREAVQRASADVDAITAIVVDHLPMFSVAQRLNIIVHTAADAAESPAVFERSECVEIDRPDEQPRRLPVRRHVSPAPPGAHNSLARTTIFLDDALTDGELLRLDHGIEYLEDKLGAGGDWLEDWSGPGSLAEIRGHAEQ